MKLLVFGHNGQVATELRGLAPDARFMGRDRADLLVGGAAGRAILETRPDAVVNASAYTAVDRAESEPDAAFALNCDAPAEMALACSQLGIPFVHVSTDYVFDGGGDRPWRPHEPVSPVNVYGQSKLAGEAAIAAAGGRYAIMRTSWVFSATGANFVKTMLRLASQRDEVSVVADQHGGPTPARAIAEALLVMTRGLTGGASGGTFHFAGAPDATWADLAREVFSAAGRKTGVREIATADYPTPARRPATSRLDCSGIREVFGLERPDWRLGVRQVVQSLGEQGI